MLQNQERHKAPKVFMHVLRMSSCARKIHLLILVSLEMALGAWDAFTVIWIAGFASWLVNTENIRSNRLYAFINHRFPSVIPTGTRDLIIWGTVVIAVLIVSRNGLRLLVTYVSNRFAILMQIETGKKIFRRIVRSDYGWFIQQQPSELMQVYQWRANVGGFMRQYIGLWTQLIVISALLAVLITYDWRITVPVLVALAIISSLLFHISRPGLDRLSSTIKGVRRRLFSEVSTTIHGLKDIRLMNAENFVENRLRDRFGDILRYSLARRFFTAIPPLLLETLSFLIFTATLILLLLYSRRGTGEVLELMAMIVLVSWRITPKIGGFLGSQASLRGTLPYVIHILEFLENPDSSDHSETDKGMNEPVYFDSLEVRNVGFLYDGGTEEILKGVSFTLVKGERLGIIGSSGSGKTTLADIISGLLVPTEGDVLLNGKPLSGKAHRGWRKDLAYVPQSPYIFPGTAAENVALGCPGMDRNDDIVEEVLDALGLDDIGKRMDSNGESLIENGRNLSGGQAQRLSLARLFYADRNVVIIDEGTSSLDAITEKTVYENLVKEGRSKTMILITHRFESLSLCDRILWLENGTVMMLDDAELVIEAYRKQVHSS